MKVGGKVIGTLGIARDITQRKHAEEEQLRLQSALQAAATDWTVTFDAVPLMMILVDAQGRLRRSNRAARQYFALTSERFAPRSLQDLGGEPWTTVQSLFDRALTTGATMAEQLDEPEGRSWSLIAAPVSSPEAAGVILTLRDTTDIVRLQRAVDHERNMAALGALVAGVAHEVRNPLFAISATLDAFEARFGKEPDFNRYVERLRPEVLRLSALMRDLLEYGRPSELHLLLGDVGLVVREAASSIGSEMAVRGVTVAIREPAEPVLVRHDPARLLQVIQNLLDNAFVHAPERSTIVVALEAVTMQDGRWLRLRIEDEGTGFRGDDLPHVFEPFYTRRRGGTGLGLSIVQRLVEQHGGKVTVENRAEGGARVTVLLPQT
jgi:signal transduction histidine kinase